MSDINETITRLECCATPGGCYSCPEKLNTTGCDRATMKEAARLLRELEADRARLLHALSRVDIDCAYCAHKDRHAKECVAADCECERCGVEECQCRECFSTHWTWNGGEIEAERS